MANITIPNLPAVTALNGSEEIEVVQASTSSRATIDQVATYTQTLYPAPGISSVVGTAPITASTVSGAVTVGIAAQGVTNQILAPMPSNTIKANITGGTGQPTDSSLTSILDTLGTTQGMMLYRGPSSWTAFPAGTNGQVLTSNGTTTIPTWQAVSASSGNIPATGVTPGTYGSASNSAQITVLASGQISAAVNVPIAVPASQVSGLGTMATQNANNVAISGGTINGTSIGSVAPSTAIFTSLTATGVVSFSTPLAETSGGTGFNSYTTGDFLYASSSTTLARLNDVATGNVILSGGVGVAPSYGKVGLTTHVSGILPVANGGTGAGTLSGYVFGNGTGAFTASATIPNAGLANSSITIGSNNISLGGTTSTLAGLTSVTVTQDPLTSLQLSTKQYVDAQVSTVSNQTYHTSVAAGSTASLTVTYSNGTGGVGATLTNAGTQAAFVIDGYTASLNDRILIKDQASGLQNGIYTVTTVGTILTNWVLTRATDFNTVGTGPNFIETGASVFVSGGSVNGSTSWNMNTAGTITVGSTALTWTQISSSASVTVTSPLQKTGSVISLNTVTVGFGGTGITSYTAGDILYAASTSSLAALPDIATGNVLITGGVGVAPSYGKVGLSTHVSGTLPVTSGGTGTTTAFTLGSVVIAGASGTYTQDNANFFWDATNHYLGLGTAVPNARLTVVSPTQTATSNTLPAGTDVHVVGADSAITRIVQDAFGTGSYAAFTSRAARGTAATPTASQTDDTLAQFTARGYGATGFGTASIGYVGIYAAENFTDSAQGSYLTLETSALGTSTAVEKFRVGPSGQWGITTTGTPNYGTAGYSFVSGGASSAPAWSQVSLTTGVTGTLPVANGGSGAATFTAGYLKANGTTAFSTVSSIPSSDITGLGTMSTQNANSVTITGGSINGTTVGASTASTGAFTTLSATTSVSFSPSGAVTINPTTAGTINNMAIGGTTRAAGAFTTVSANAATSPSNTIGAISYGTNNFSDTDVLANFTSSVNSYNQVSVQNTSAGAAASAAFIAYNNTATPTSGFATVGINSTGYTGTGAINAPGNGYLLSGGGDLVVGTINSNAIHFVTNSSATDAMTISSAGIVSLGTALAITSGGTGTTTSTGTGALVLANSPTLVTPALGTPSAIVLTNGTGLPISTGVSGLGASVATALSFTVNTTGGVITTGVTTLPSLVSIGTIATGVWNGTLIGSTYGGTGVNNGSATLTMAGNVTHAGSFTQSFTATANTAVTLPTTGTLATLAGAETLTTKRINPRISSAASASSLTVDISTYDQYVFTALAATLTINASTTGTPVNGSKMVIRIKDNGTPQTLTWTTSGAGGFRVIGTTLPVTTTASKVLYVGCIYNSDESFWDVVAVTTQA